METKNDRASDQFTIWFVKKYNRTPRNGSTDDVMKEVFKAGYAAGSEDATGEKDP